MPICRHDELDRGVREREAQLDALRDAYREQLQVAETDTDHLWSQLNAMPTHTHTQAPERPQGNTAKQTHTVSHLSMCVCVCLFCVNWVCVLTVSVCVLSMMCVFFWSKALDDHSVCTCSECVRVCDMRSSAFPPGPKCINYIFSKQRPVPNEPDDSQTWSE